MADNVGSKVSFFLVGLGVGALLGVLFAPKSGEETREYLGKRADELIERGKDVASRKRESLSAAVEAGREAFLRESKS